MPSFFIAQYRKAHFGAEHQGRTNLGRGLALLVLLANLMVIINRQQYW